MLWLGDSLHTLDGRAAAEAFLRETSTSVTVLAGNHDLRWSAISGPATRRDDLLFHHGDQPAPAGVAALEIIGHHHPALSWADGAGTRLKLPALVAEPRRLILPAFSPWAAGTPWNDRLGSADTLWAIAPRRIFPVKSHQLKITSIPA